jgi:hypothetical protein
MGPQFDYLGQAGDYHMFRDQATGEEYPVGQEDADYLMAQQAAAPMQSMQPPQPAEENVPLTGVIGIPGQASAPSPGLPKLQGIPQEFGGAPPAAPSGPSNLQRVMPRQSAGPQPRMRGPGVIDNGDGTVSTYRAGSKGGWQDTARRTSGVDPALVSPQLEAENSLYQRERENAMTAEEIRRDQLLAEREAAAAARQEAELKRQQADAKVAQLNADRDNKWQEFSRRQENIKQMKVDPSAGENWATVLLSALAAGAGAYGSAMTGSPNFALDILNRAKEQKINAQQYAISKAKDDLGTEREEYDRYLSVTLDGRKLEQQAAIERQQIEETRQLKADEGLRGLAPQLDDLLAQLERQHNQTLSQIYNQYQVEAAERYVPPTAGGWSRTVDPELKLRNEVAGLQRGSAGGTSETEIRTPDGEVIGTAPDKEARREMNTRIAAYAEAERLGAQMLELVQKQQSESSLGFRDEEDKARYNSLAVRYKNALWSATRSDAPSESESEQFANAMGGLDLANFRTGKQRSVLQQTLEDGRNNLADRIKQVGGDPSYLRSKKRNVKNEGFVP